MIIKIKNCKNIDFAEIGIKEKELNIKYGINGVGKSTIAEALERHVSHDSDKALKKMLPYKYYENPNPSFLPSVEIENVHTNVGKIAVFNEKYIEEYVFKEDEVINDSFNIFVKSDEYEKLQEEIQNDLKGITEKFDSGESENYLNAFIDDLSELDNNLGKETQKGFSKAGSLHKGIGEGNKLEHFPNELLGYKPFLEQDRKSIEWIEWQNKGLVFLEIGDKCPFCVEPLSKMTKDKIEKMGNTFNKKLVQSILNILSTFDKLQKYLTEEANQKVKEISLNQNGIGEEDNIFLKTLKKEALLLYENLTKLKRIDFFQLRKLNIDHLETELEEYKIDLSEMQYFKSRYTIAQIKLLNDAINEQIKKVIDLKNKINKQQNLLTSTIEKNKKNINSFLQKAGFNYVVTIEQEKNTEQYKAMLKTFSSDFAISGGKEVLSFGERNAFALIMFMLDSLKKDVDFIILDDPISSFDTHKKYAIIDTLFKGENSFRNKTVMLLTHDFDPVYEMIFVDRRNFQPVNAVFLENQKGHLIEKEIKKENIKSIILLFEENIQKSEHIIHKLINMRQWYELTGKKNEEWDVISSLFKKRKVPTNIEQQSLDAKKIKDASEKIAERIGAKFDYNECFNLFNDNLRMINAYKNAKSGYEKVQIVRLLSVESKDVDNHAFKKFLDETYHVQNNYIYQLNPKDYEIVPPYVLKWCDEYINSLNNVAQYSTIANDTDNLFV